MHLTRSSLLRDHVTIIRAVSFKGWYNGTAITSFFIIKVDIYASKCALLFETQSFARFYSLAFTSS